MSKTIIFFGNEQLATGITSPANSLSALIEAGYDVAALVLNKSAQTSRSSKQLDVEVIAQNHKIPVITSVSDDKLAEMLKSYQPDIGVLAAYGKIVPQSLINMFPHGIVNIHPSLLPLHRGSTPIESAILSGDSKTGVSLMKIVQAMDSGPVYKQVSIELTGNETKQGLTDTLSKLGSKLLVDNLPNILSDSLNASPQDETKATYDKLITKTDGQLDFNKPATQLEREIRAYALWPKSRFRLKQLDCVIVNAGVSDLDLPVGKVKIVGDQMFIGCSQNSLSIEEIQPASKRPMSTKEFISGYSKYIG